MNIKDKKDDNQADKTGITLVNSNIKMRDRSGNSSNVHDISSQSLSSRRGEGRGVLAWWLAGLQLNIPIWVALLSPLSSLLHPYNFLQLNMVACTEAEAPQGEDEMSSPGLLLGSISESGRSVLEFSKCSLFWEIV